MAEARKDATYSVELMRERYSRIVTDEVAKNGLVILAALYGKLLNGTDYGDIVFTECCNLF